MSAIEALAQELSQTALNQIIPQLEVLARTAFEQFRYSPDAVINIPKARKIFGLSRSMVEKILIEQQVSVRFKNLGGSLGESKLFIHGDFATAVRRWLSAK